MTFVGCWLLLNAVLNVRYPASEAQFWYLLPSLDVTVLLFLYIVAGACRLRLPTWVQVAIAGSLLFVRLLRFGDGVEEVYLRTFNFYLDFPLLPELARLLYVTVPHPRLALELLIGALSMAALAVVTYQALRYAERYLAEPQHRRVFAGIAGLFALVSIRPPSLAHPDHFVGVFGASIVPRFVEEGAFLLHAGTYRDQKINDIVAAQDHLRHLPTGLEKLHGAPVLLFIIESYGATVFADATYAERMRPTYDRFEASLQSSGFSMVSGLLDSSTYGGRSWLAHATLATGVRVPDQLSYSLLAERAHATMAGFFRAAGYDTVLVQPGTTYKTPEPDRYGFERAYFAWDLDYHGPSYLWVPMPDQYVLDFVHRRELARGPRPLFVEMALVSSHAPWSAQPEVVDDWSALGGGDIFNQLQTTRFPVSWNNLAGGGEAYLHSVRYDFTVLQQYFEKLAPDGALLILIGDHQPVSEVARQSSPAVPVHILSKNHQLTDAFAAQGYVAGMRPRTDGRVPGMETFLPTLLQALSNGQAPAVPQ